MPIQVIVQVYPLHSNKAALVTGPQYNMSLLTVMDEVDQQIKWYKFSGRYQHLPTWHRDIRCQLIKYTWSVGMSTTIVNCWLSSFTWQYPTYLVIRNTPTTQREIHCCVKLCYNIRDQWRPGISRVNRKKQQKQTRPISVKFL